MKVAGPLGKIALANVGLASTPMSVLVAVLAGGPGVGVDE